MSDYEYLTGICRTVLNPLAPGYVPITEEEKQEILQYEYEMHQMCQEELEDWPPYDIALEL